MTHQCCSAVSSVILNAFVHLQFVFLCFLPSFLLLITHRTTCSILPLHYKMQLSPSNHQGLRSRRARQTRPTREGLPTLTTSFDRVEESRSWLRTVQNTFNTVVSALKKPTTPVATSPTGTTITFPSSGSESSRGVFVSDPIDSDKFQKHPRPANCAVNHADGNTYPGKVIDLDKIIDDNEKQKKTNKHMSLHILSIYLLVGCYCIFGEKITLYLLILLLVFFGATVSKYMLPRWFFE